LIKINKQFDFLIYRCDNGDQNLYSKYIKKRRRTPRCFHVKIVCEALRSIFLITFCKCFRCCVKMPGIIPYHSTYQKNNIEKALPNRKGCRTHKFFSISKNIFILAIRSFSRRGKIEIYRNNLHFYRNEKPPTK